MPKKKYYLQATSPFGQKIHVTKSYWDYIAKQKHPEIKGQEQNAIATLKNPDIIKQSPVDKKVFLYYSKTKGKYFCITAKHLNAEGFIITAYITKKLAKEEIIWQKPKR